MGEVMCVCGEVSSEREKGELAHGPHVKAHRSALIRTALWCRAGESSLPHWTGPLGLS